MKPLLILAAVVALAAGTVVPSRADTPPPTEKCDDLQNRCLHRENGICQIWHDECMIRRPTSSHGGHEKKLRYGRRHHV